MKTLCFCAATCNSTKGDKDLPYLMNRLKEKGIIKGIIANVAKPYK